MPEQTTIGATTWVPPTQDIRNTHDQLVAAGGGVAIIQAYGFNVSHKPFVSGYLVYRIDAEGNERQTDPQDRTGRKYFSTIYNADGSFQTGTINDRFAHALAEAQAWVATQGWYKGEWRSNQFRDYVPFPVNALYKIKGRRLKDTSNI